MYDRGVPVSIMDTYVPIDFRNLYLIGAQQKQDVERATQQLSNTIQKFGEFHSPSDIDTENWYNLTLNNPVIKGLIDEASRNPDALKDAGWRAKLNAGLMGINYGALSRLQQSKEGMLARQKANQELMLRGGYNPLLHDVDFSNYNTLDSDIFNDISPLAYQSTVDMVKPFVDNLKGRYLGTQNGFIYNGVDAEDTDNQLKANWSSIITSPHYAQNLQLIKLQNPGISDEAAIDALNQQIITAGREFTWNDVQRDPLAVAYARHSGNGSEDEQPFILSNLTDQLEQKAADKFDTMFSDIATEEDARRKLANLFNTSYSDSKDVSSAIDVALEGLTDGIDPEANSILTRQNVQTGKMTDNGWYVGTSSNKFHLRRSLLESLVYGNKDAKTRFRLKFQSNGKAKDKNSFMEDFHNGKFKNFFVAGEPSIVTDGQNIYHNNYIYIPKSELNDYSSQDIAEAQGEEVTLNADQVRYTDSTDQYGQTKSSQSLKAGKYIKIPAVTTVPTMGQEAVSNDAIHAASRKIGQDLRDAMQVQSEKRRLYNIK